MGGAGRDDGGGSGGGACADIGGAEDKLAGTDEDARPAGVLSAISLTMICSPLLSPRLASGSSGMIVRALGGYPAFTGFLCREECEWCTRLGSSRTVLTGGKNVRDSVYLLLKVLDGEIVAI